MQDDGIWGAQDQQDLFGSCVWACASRAARLIINIIYNNVLIINVSYDNVYGWYW